MKTEVLTKRQKKETETAHKDRKDSKKSGFKKKPADAKDEAEERDIFKTKTKKER